MSILLLQNMFCIFFLIWACVGSILTETEEKKQQSAREDEIGIGNAALKISTMKYFWKLIQTFPTA